MDVNQFVCINYVLVGMSIALIRFMLIIDFVISCLSDFVILILYSSALLY